jgi:hypothetical protein
MTEDAAEDVSVSLDIRDGQTVISVTGSRDIGVVVESATGERVYLPPSDYDEATQTTPYRSGVYQSPYEGSADSSYDTPHGGTGDDTPSGVVSTSQGLRIVHPEPVTDCRLVR